jgi:hypothetical protein
MLVNIWVRRRGRKVILVNHTWCYADDLAPVWRKDGDGPYPSVERPCPKCGLTAQCEPDGRYGPDPCLGYLPGVIGACCGHGFIEDTYVRFAPDGKRGLTGLTAINFIKEAAL